MRMWIAMEFLECYEIIAVLQVLFLCCHDNSQKDRCACACIFEIETKEERWKKKKKKKKIFYSIDEANC